MWLTIDEAAQYLKISKETLYKMAQKNQVPASKLGSQWRFNRRLVDHWLEAQSEFESTVRQEKGQNQNTRSEDTI